MVANAQHHITYSVYNSNQKLYSINSNCTQIITLLLATVMLTGMQGLQLSVLINQCAPIINSICNMLKAQLGTMH